MDTPEHPDPDAVRAERNHRMVEDWRSGASITEIARRYGLSANWTGVLLRQNGAALPETGRGFRLDLDADRIVTAYLDGATVRELADAHDVSYGKVYRLLRQHRVPMRPRGGRPQQ